MNKYHCREWEKIMKEDGLTWSIPKERELALIEQLVRDEFVTELTLCSWRLVAIEAVVSLEPLSLFYVYLGRKKEVERHEVYYWLNFGRKLRPQQLGISETLNSLASALKNKRSLVYILPELESRL